MSKFYGREGAQVIKAVLRLYIIHLSAFIAVWLGTYYPGLDLLLAVLYLFIVVREAVHQHSKTWRGAVLLVLVWQLPGLFFSIIILTRYNPFDLYNYAIFVLELWYTPLLPFLSILPNGSFEKPLYYYALVWMPFIYLAVFPVISRNKLIRRLLDS